jgi:beta-mannosidase
MSVDLGPGQSKRIHAWTSDKLQPAPDRYLVVRSPNDTFPANRHFFTAIKDLDRDPATVQHTIKQIDSHHLDVTLEAPAGAYAYFVNIGVPHAGTKFSDNFFDLEPGERRTIAVTNSAHPLSPQDLTIRSR